MLGTNQFWSDPFKRVPFQFKTHDDIGKSSEMIFPWRNLSSSLCSTTSTPQRRTDTRGRIEESEKARLTEI